MSAVDLKCRALQGAGSSLAIGVVASAALVLPAHAQSPKDQETAITRTADDSGLQWGPCPAFLPEGCRIAVLHGDPAKANADLFFEVPAGAELPLHWHSSAERMVLVAGELHVTYEGQPAAIMKAGTYAYGPARRPHSGVCASAVPCVLFIAFESPVDAVPSDSKTTANEPDSACRGILDVWQPRQESWPQAQSSSR